MQFSDKFFISAVFSYTWIPTHQRSKLVLRVMPLDLRIIVDRDVKIEICPLVRIHLIS